MHDEKDKEIGRRYIIERKLGHGAMGEVYLAMDHRLHRNVAIKMLHVAKLKSEETRKGACTLFLAEARITGNLNHGHITTIYDMGIHDGMPYIVMEYLDGKNLKEIMADQRQKFSCKEKLNILVIIAQALHYAHQRYVLHRDIKPANIMITGNGTPKITDFGIASIVGASGGGRNLCRDEYLLAGTPQYMSPEHIGGENFDARSDIFSLGILAYEWLSGHKPFAGGSVQEIMDKIITGSPAPLSKVCAVDAKLEAIVHKALARNPGDRCQSAEEFSDALVMYLNTLEEGSVHEVKAYLSGDRGRILSSLKRKYLFFSDFSEEELLAIVKLSQKKKYLPGEYIIREGTVGSKMYVIISGSVSVQTEAHGKEIEIDRLEPGGCVGEMALVDRMPRSASVVAVEPTIAIAINDTVLRLANPVLCLKLYRNFAMMLSERLRNNDRRYRELPEDQA